MKTKTIKTFNQFELIEFFEPYKEDFSASLVPIYIEDPDKKTQGILFGTSFLVHVGCCEVLISAAHVFNGIHSGHQLFTIVKDGTRWDFPKKVGEPFRSLRDHDNDVLDIGIIKIPQSFTKFLVDGGHEILSTESLRPNAVPRHNKNYLIGGFPSSKNKFKYNSNELKRHAFFNISAAKSEEVYKEEDIEPGKNILIEFNKKDIFKNEETKTNPPALNGLSGSPVWILSDSDIEEFNPMQDIRICGILTDFIDRKNMIKATEIGIALDVVKRDLCK